MVQYVAFMYMCICVSTQGQRKGRKVKNEVVAEKIVTFSLPANFDVATTSASDIDKVKQRLGKWRIQRRERDTKANDTVNDIK